jgi:hypothetical protein
MGERGIRHWVDEVGKGWGARAAASLRSALAAATVNGHEVDLHHLGYRLFEHGHPIDEILGWFSWLERHRPRLSARILGRSSGTVSLCSGWAAAALAADDDHFVSLEVLRLRLHQHFQLATQLEVPPGEHVAIVVLQCLSGAAAPCEGASPVLAEHARRVFGRGETVALSPGSNVLILAQRNAELNERIRHLDAMIKSDPALRGSTTRMWIEPVGASHDVLNAYLDELANASMR